ncbi:apolipoprotein O, b isoform X1 [Astyanax mexicanus]|uniref:MICOS complex subunit n=2 Tax=Astyanax mexicanus TaxID=7994 RepID=W5L3T1_ASTMX|nr:apolipoprotein O, b isoform X1 [Astyanax mexicanus]
MPLACRSSDFSLITVGMLNSGRLLKAALPVAVSGTLYLMSGTVLAASDAEDSRPSLMVDELSLYTTPQSQAKYVEQEVGHVEQGVASLRKSAEPYTSWCQEKISYGMDRAEVFYKTIEPGVDTSIQTVKESYEFLSNPPPGFYPSVGIVGFSGILGLYLAKSCRVKRLLYPAGLMTLSASLFYPQHAASVAKISKDQISSWVSQGPTFAESLWKRKSDSKEK